MEGSKEIFLALFRLMKCKGLLSETDYNNLNKSMNFIDYHVFIDTVNKICEKSE